MRPVRAVILLTLICLPVMFWNLTDLGLFNTQEAIRVNVAREMQRAGEWLVPVRRGEPYIAKPPMVYWSQIALAKLRGGEVGEFELRLNAALWGWFGVLATYFAARSMLRADPPDCGVRGPRSEVGVPVNHDQLSASGALWSAVAMAVGVLPSLSARVGELDVMLIAPVAAAVACMHASWRHFLAHGRAHWGCVVLATFAAVIAGFIKGPSGLVTILLGGSASTLVYTLVTRRAPTIVGRPVSRGWWWFKQLESTHPVLVIGLPAVLLWLWLRHARERIGAERFAGLVNFEATDNLRWFDFEGMARYAEALSYALGAFTIAAFAGLWLAWKRRRTASTGTIAALCWLVLGVAAFAVTTKGVGRYLTPVWPAMAMLAGVACAAWISGARYRMRAVSVLAVTAAVQGGALTWWHAVGRTEMWAERSPRELMRELLTRPDLGGLGSLNFNYDAFDFYAGRVVETWGTSRFATPLGVLVERVRAIKPGEHAYTLLVLEENEKNRREFGSAAALLRGAGLAGDEVPVRSIYRRPPGDARVLVWRLRPDRYTADSQTPR